MINKVVIVGRLTKTPILQTTSKGRKTVFINLATNLYSEHQKKSITNYVSMKLWGHTAEFAARKGKKGMEVSVEGMIKTSSYTNDQDKQIYVTEVIVEKFHLLSGQFEEELEQSNHSITSEFEQFVNALK